MAMRIFWKETEKSQGILYSPIMASHKSKGGKEGGGTIVSISVVWIVLSCVETLYVEVATEDVAEVKDVVDVDAEVDRTDLSVDPSEETGISFVSNKRDVVDGVAMENKKAINI